MNETWENNQIESVTVQTAEQQDAVMQEVQPEQNVQQSGVQQ